ncbi:hypothetical protein PIB30_022644 [Stylosanthes scabra]|uniref:Uncharacterized protein n=1 Tax=Stylosanthes scabra TaxID=79078 RepID=A0ABU6T8Z0_9FABA|nr:hypothetical protein [Stylosanthes scabra]
MAGTLWPLSPLDVERVPDPLVEEALRPDDFDDEPAFIEGDSDPIPTQQGGVSSSDTQQYPPHLFRGRATFLCVVYVQLVICGTLQGIHGIHICTESIVPSPGFCLTFFMKNLCKDHVVLIYAGTWIVEGSNPYLMRDELELKISQVNL